MIDLEMIFLFGSLCVNISLWAKNEKRFKEIEAVFDTGAHTTHIDTDVLEYLGYDLNESDASYINTVASDSLRVNNTTIDNIKIGHLELGAVLVNFSELSLHFPVILGMNIIKEFNINLDFKNSIISMEPNFDTDSKIPVERFNKSSSRFGMWAINAEHTE